MADNQTSLEILIRTIAENAGIEATQENLARLRTQVQEAAKDMGVLVVSQEEVEAATKKTGEAVEDEGKKVEEAGHHAGNAKLQHMALHHAFSELNKISPGLGVALNMLTRGLHSVGNESETAGEKMSAMITTVGPLIIAMLAIQTVTTYWDLYKEKLKEVAHEQEELTKTTQQETAKMLKAIEALNEAMHPKEKNQAEKDKEELKQRKQHIEDMAEEQAARNKKAETDDLAAAGGDKTKEGKIKSEFERATKALNEWKLQKLAEADAEMVQKMNQQTSALHAKAEGLVSGEEERSAFKASAGTDKYGKSAQGQLDAMGQEHWWNSWRAAMSDLGILPDVEGDVEKSLIEHQSEGTKNLKDIREKAEGLEKEGTSIAGAREGVSDEAEAGAHRSRQTRRINRIGQGLPTDQDILSKLPGVISAEQGNLYGGHPLTGAQAKAILELKKMLDDAHENTKAILAVVAHGAKKNESTAQIIADVKALMGN